MKLVKSAISILASLGMLAGLYAMTVSAENAESPVPVFTEDFEEATGNGMGSDNGTGVKTVYGDEANDGKITLATQTVNNDLVISGTQSIVVNHKGGDQGSFAFGDDSNLRFSPDKVYTVSFLMKPKAALPNDFNLMLQVMSWSGANWGDEMYVTASGGKPVAGTTKHAALPSMIMPKVSVEEKSTDIYQITAVFSGADIKNNDGEYSSFFRLRPMGATASIFSVDDIQVLESELANEPIYTESFDNAIGFDEWGVVTGTNGVSFPRGKGTNDYHAIASTSDDTTRALVISGAKSLVVKKTGADNVESFSFGNNDSFIRFDSERRYVFAFDMKTDGVLPTDFALNMQMMNWPGPVNYSNEVSFTKASDGTLKAETKDSGAMLEGAAKADKNGVYRIVVAFNGMNVKENEKFASFIRAVFAGTPSYTVSVDNFNVYISNKALNDYLPADEGDTDTTTKPSTETTNTTAPKKETMSKLGDPLIFDDMEKAVKVDADAVSVHDTLINWPFPGGQSNLFIADKNGENAEAVIAGDKSILIKNLTSGAQITVNTGKGELLKLSKDKTYVASFKIKFVEVPADGFNMVVRTWTQGDKWVTVKLKPDNGNLTATVTENKQDCNKVAVKKLSDGSFHVAVRFQGVESSTDCYLYWDLEKGAVSFDDFALYESDKEPALALEKGDKAPSTGETPLVLVCVGLTASAAGILTLLTRKAKKQAQA